MHGNKIHGEFSASKNISISKGNIGKRLKVSINPAGCSTALFSSIYSIYIFALPTLDAIFIFAHCHTLNIHSSTPHSTFCLLFTPLNSYSVCSIILHTRTFCSLVSYSWNNVLTAGYTVCIFTALMYVQFAFICKYRPPLFNQTRDDNNH